MTSRITHVVFDLDGTLLDTERLYTAATEQVVSAYGATFTMELKRQTMGGDTLSGAELVVNALGLPLDAPAFVAAREQALRGLLPTLTPMRGAEALVAALSARGIPMGLATSGHREITEHKLSLQPFLSAMRVVITGDDPRLRAPKPAPDIFLLAASELGAAPSACIAFEDSANGVLAATRAGMRTVALVDPEYGFDPALFAEAAHVVASLSDVDLDALLR